jgi:hypothetical protein
MPASIARAAKESSRGSIAGLSEEEYSKVVNLAQKASGSSTKGNAGNNDIAPPMDVETCMFKMILLHYKKIITRIIF